MVGPSFVSRRAGDFDAVATAPNAVGDRSRIEAVALGTVTISARDRASGISSSSGDGDAQLTIYDPAAHKPGAGATAPTGDRSPRTVCGDASGDGVLAVSDPLWILAGVVDVAECPLAVCDVDADGVVASRDAMNVGWVVMGYDVTLMCRRSAAR